MSARTLLSQSDFTYLGYYDNEPGSGFTNPSYGAGLAHRYVGGQLRFLSFDYESGVGYLVREFVLPASFGDNVTALGGWTSGNLWNGLGAPAGFHVNIWVDTSDGTVWTNYSNDYPQNPSEYNYSSVVSNCALSTNHGGSIDPVTNWQGFWGFQGIGQRSLYGGIRHVPTWFQTANSVGAYVVGFGGYASLYAQGLGACLGPMLVFTPDPRGFTQEAFDLQFGGIASGNWKFGADTRAGNGSTSWYATEGGPGYASRTLDRGCMLPVVTNWFDSNDNRPNPMSRPTYPTDLASPNHWWTGDGGHESPGDPDSYARWTWGGTIEGSWEWIDNDAGSRSKHGIAAIYSGFSGYCYYQGSSFAWDNSHMELQLYDPDDVAAIVAGSAPVWSLRPYAVLNLDTIMAASEPGPGTGYGPRAFGATFDATTNLLYVAVYAGQQVVAGVYVRIYVFQVAA